ncbi:MAG: hypothetical protein JXA42_09960 [Anaerolineales bacterium]|nr:hypothetical protein [Anaerolineales bacterium]
MAQTSEFEQRWLEKFSNCIEQSAGQDIRDQVMQGSQYLPSQSNHHVRAWTRTTLERLQLLVGKDKLEEIMTGCACQYSPAALQKVRDFYQSTGNLEQAHAMLQEQFESFLRETLNMEASLIDEIIRRGWGLAGVLQGNVIVATKIPKSSNLAAYMAENDPLIRRQLYCHCPRVRDALASSESIPLAYCYCGAGFYKGIWEEITQQPVQIKVIKSVLGGDDVCTFSINLIV